MRVRLRSAVARSAAVASVLVLVGCTHSSPKPLDVTVTQTTTSVRTSAGPVTGLSFSTVAPLPPGQAPASGESERRCPYIASTPDENPTVNVADLEGDHVYRTTVLTAMNPVGCRFYFYSGPYEAITEISTHRYSSAVEANNAMVLTAQRGRQAEGHQNIVPGVNAVVFQTHFFGPDGAADWACAFAKGSVLVVVRTQQDNVSYNALQLAVAIAPKF
jgi:hypothetical protein